MTDYASSGRIAVFYPWANLDTVPSLCQAIEMMAAAGFGVDVFARRDAGYPVPDFGDDNVALFSDCPRWMSQGAYRLLPVSWRRPVLAWRRHRRQPYRALIGVDPQGLLQAAEFNRLIKLPLLYYSFELLLSSEIRPRRKDLQHLKKQERTLSAAADKIIIQDEQRARLMAEDNGLPLDRFVCVPNSPRGPARRQPARVWHDRFGLSESTKVVLHAGSLYEWTGIEQIAGSVSQWPENWVLVVHTRSRGESAHPLKFLRALADPGRVLVSDTPVGRREYAALVDSADAGIAFYVPGTGTTYDQKNIEVIGFSSGKLAHYLQAGLPVIVNRASTLGEFVRRTGCGVDVRDGSEIGKALESIDADVDQYSLRACRAFDEHLDFEKPFADVISALKNMA